MIKVHTWGKKKKEEGNNWVWLGGQGVSRKIFQGKPQPRAGLTTEIREGESQTSTASNLTLVHMERRETREEKEYEWELLT